MLNTLRNSLTGWVVKIFLGLLAIIFVFWGIGGDVVGGQSSLAFKVGDNEYSNQRWEHALRERKEFLKNQGSEIDTDSDEVRLYILGQIINQELLKKEVESLGLLIGDEAVKYEIINNLSGITKDGKFDREQFGQMLKRAGLSEANFINKVKEELSQRILVEVVSSGKLSNDILLKQVAKALTSKREFEIFQIDNKKLKNSSEPTDEELMDLLQKNKEAFSTHEVRDISYFTVSLDMKRFRNEDKIGEEEIQKFYKEQSYLFKKPERRSVVKLVFKDEKSAEEAHETLLGGKDFTSLAKELKQQEGISPSSPLVYDGFEENIAHAMFSLAKGEISKPVSTPLGWYIFSVAEVFPESLEDISNVKGEIVKYLQEQKQYESYDSLVQSINRQIDRGASIEKIADNNGFKINKAQLIEGKKDETLLKKFGNEEYDILVQGLFSAHEKELVMNKNDNQEISLIFVVDIIKPGEVKEFKTIKEDLKVMWMQKDLDGIGQNLMIKAKQQEIEGGDAKGKNDSITSKKITLDLMSPNSEVPFDQLIKIFSLQRNQCSEIFKGQSGTYKFVKLLDVRQASPEVIDEAIKTKVKNIMNLQGMLSGDYLNYLRDIHKVEIYNIEKSKNPESDL